jgi:hypothetical protein
LTDNRKKYIFIIQAIIFGLAIGLYLIEINTLTRFPQGTDFLKFYMSSKFYWTDKSIYTPIPLSKSFSIANVVNYNHPNLNSPFHALCMTLFGLLDFPTAFWIWSLFSLFCGLLAIALFYGNMVDNNISLTSLMNIWIIFLIYFPTWISVRLGQFSLVLLLLIVLAWKAFTKKKDYLAGMILGLATGLKLFVGIFLIVFIVYHRWRLILCLIGTFLFCNIISLVIFKIPAFEKFFSLLQNMPWYGASWNASFMGFFSRIFGGSMNTPLVNLPWLARTLSILLSLALIAWMVWLARPHSLGLESDRFDLVFSLALVAMLLISPYGWLYYFPILILPMIVAWRISEKYYFSKLYKIVIILAWGLTTIPTRLIWAEDLKMNQPIIWFTSAGVYFYALLIISAIFIGLIHKLNKPLLRQEAARMLK